MKLDIIGITDHNSTLHTSLLIELGKEKGIFVLPGAEVTSQEEVHCLAFFEAENQLKEFQDYLNTHLSVIKNEPNIFGYQVVVNRDEEIIYEEKRLLIASISQSIDQLEKKIHELNGLFIPAHIDRGRFSLTSQLGFIPSDLKADAFELTEKTSLIDFMKANPKLVNYTIIRSSDAHTPDRIGAETTEFYMNSCTFKEIKMALKNENGRKILAKL